MNHSIGVIGSLFLGAIVVGLGCGNGGTGGGGAGGSASSSTTASVGSGGDGGSSSMSTATGGGGSVSSAATGGGGAGATVEQACSALATARCTKLGACSAVRLAQIYGDLSGCEARVKLSCADALDAPMTGESPAATKACAAETASWGCDDYLVGANPPPDCVQKTGPFPLGKACFESGQCASGLCVLGGASTCGTCETAPSVGQPCVSNRCGPGLACAADLTCQPPALLDQSCANQACEPGLRCVQGSCLAIDSTVADGEPCGSLAGPGGGMNVACTLGMCVHPMGQSGSTCVGDAPDGAACDAALGPNCMSPASCIDGTCQEPKCP